MATRKKGPSPPKQRNPVAKALRVLKPKTVGSRRAYKRKAKHPASPPNTTELE
jgi:hypothetical protein